MVVEPGGLAGRLLNLGRECLPKQADISEHLGEGSRNRNFGSGFSAAKFRILG